MAASPTELLVGLYWNLWALGLGLHRSADLGQNAVGGNPDGPEIWSYEGRWVWSRGGDWGRGPLSRACASGAWRPGPLVIFEDSGSKRRTSCRYMAPVALLPPGEAIICRSASSVPTYSGVLKSCHRQLWSSPSSPFARRLSLAFFSLPPPVSRPANALAFGRQSAGSSAYLAPETSTDDLPGVRSRYDDFVGTHIVQADFAHFVVGSHSPLLTRLIVTDSPKGQVLPLPPSLPARVGEGPEHLRMEGWSPILGSEP